MGNICNQYFVKDKFRDKKHAGTVKCSVCGEQSNFTEKFPFELKKFNEFISAFEKLHDKKGCNKVKVDDQFWQSGKIDIGISIGI